MFYEKLKTSYAAYFLNINFFGIFLKDDDSFSMCKRARIEKETGDQNLSILWNN